MKFFRLLLRKTWRVLFFLNGVLTFFLLWPAFYIFLSWDKWFKNVFWLKLVWARMLTYNVGIRFKVIRKIDVKNKGPFVICPNHSSYLDIILTYPAVPSYFHFMGKAELQKVPFFSKFFDRMNILVNRGSIFASHKAFIRAGDDLDKGISVAIFPEATIPDCAPHLGRFKNGAFKLAIEKQVPVIPVVFLDNWRILPDTKKHQGGGPGLSRIIVHDPVETKGLTESDIPQLKTKIFSIIDTTLKQYDYGNKR